MMMVKKDGRDWRMSERHVERLCNADEMLCEMLVI